MKAFVLLALILIKEIACEHSLKNIKNEIKLTNKFIELKNDSIQDSDQFFTFLDSKLKKKEFEKFIPEEYKDYFESRDIALWKSMRSLTDPLEYYLPTKSSSTRCHSALKKLKRPNNFGFTINMMDSWGKNSDGILWGNYRPIGMYEQCLYLQQNSLKGKYCYIKLRVSGNEKKEEIYMPNPQNMINRGISLSLFKLYSYGTCIPNDCTTQDMQESLSLTLENSKTHAVVACHGPDDKRALTGGDISLIVYLSVMCVILLAATCLDIIATPTLRTGPLRFLLVFSVSTNLRKIFHISSPPSKESISCLHGMRVFSMVWVIYGHQYIFTVTSTLNLADIGRKTDGFLFQIFANATFSVDSFFFLSGLLVGYLSFKAMSISSGRLNIIMFYVHRYLRLTPAIAMTAWFQATLSRFFVSGPYSSNYDVVVENCKNSWWKDILYINNYAVSLHEPGKMDCIAQAWYTATDTQIFLFMPLVLIPLYRYNKMGKVWLGFVTLVACIVPASITVGLDLSPFTKMNETPEKADQYMRYIYVAPFSRAGPYLIGIGAGYILFIRKSLRMRKWQVAVGWTLSTALALSLLFGVYNYNILGPDAKSPYGNGFQFFYGGFSRTLWAIPLAWIVIACHYGYGGPVNWFLSHPALQPLSRLTYTMFLMALGIQYIVTLSNRQFYYFNHINKIIETCGIFFLIGIAAVILSILIEVPLINLEKEIRRKPVSKIQNENGIAKQNGYQNNGLNQIAQGTTIKENGIAEHEISIAKLSENGHNISGQENNGYTSSIKVSKPQIENGNGIAKQNGHQNNDVNQIAQGTTIKENGIEGHEISIANLSKRENNGYTSSITENSH